MEGVPYGYCPLMKSMPLYTRLFKDSNAVAHSVDSAGLKVYFWLWEHLRDLV